MEVGGVKTWVVLARSHKFSNLPEKEGVIRVEDFQQACVMQSDGNVGSRGVCVCVYVCVRCVCGVCVVCVLCVCMCVCVCVCVCVYMCVYACMCVCVLKKCEQVLEQKLITMLKQL